MEMCMGKNGIFLVLVKYTLVCCITVPVVFGHKTVCLDSTNFT